MTGVPDPGPVPVRITVDVPQVRRLLAEQLPAWAGLPVTPVDPGGWDNRTFRLGDDMLVRLPSAAPYALAVAKEQRWLPLLAPALPQPIPVPLAEGRPGAGYPFPWSVYRWIAGETARSERVADPVRFAEDLADLVRALRGVDATGGPRPGAHNWFRGAPLRTYDAGTRAALRDLGGRVDADRAMGVWTRALGASWRDDDVWFHGDLAAGNILLDRGELCGVIDFGTCGVGDPSCDLAVAWTLLTDDGRRAFRDRLPVDDDAWARGRGWAIWKALTTCAGDADPADRQVRDARRALDRILASADDDA
ncbi:MULTISPECIES: aminoglycoside phosphotransferase family protein [Clavibacter]|uniref:Aminoglycoside phosphotransferase n=1 Tax=Clavibacter tessellarius TaxID=31965 RepID=A0A154UZF3_9MICO|nr:MULTISPECIES: aminoglycoside phosphotransferase family protein [Clavibacter]KZC94475.1 aminoglycoside phosphotransferase [Clavibacter michiganensis subsp. tessellarius]MDA3805805.1 aminoglycoside phosphotransferase family protein [Clavibacter sp. CT19]